jgi:signal transduction histidine kinase
LPAAQLSETIRDSKRKGRIMSRRKTKPRAKDPWPSDPIYRIAESTAAEIGTDFLSALVRCMHDAMDVSVALITRGIGEPPVRARAAFSWRKAGSEFPEEYDLEGTPCSLVYQGQRLLVPEELWRKFPRDAGKEGYCGVPLRNSSGRVAGHFSVFSDLPIASPERAEGIMRIFGLRVEAELQRIESEREREALVARLSHAIGRLDHQHRRTRRANEFKTEALSMVAHDLRSPLAAIINRAEFIGALIDKDAAGGDKDKSASTLREKLHASCAAISRSADRMEQMIADLLVSARNEASAISLRCTAVDLADPVRTAIGLNQAAANGKQLRISETLTHAGRIMADEDRLIEAIDNLLSNAVKYSSTGGAIVVETGSDADAGFAFVRISDRGQGMSEEDVAQAFQRFQRLSAKPTAGESSTGLGLAIVKAIAEAHGGSVEAASAGKGHGSAFTLRLSVVGPAPVQEPQS